MGASNVSDTPDDTSSTDEPDTGTPSNEPPPDAPQVDDTSTVAEIAEMAKELGITPGQLKGRLEASRKWEQRAKKADADLEAARLAGLDEQQRAIEEARTAGKAEATAELGQRIAVAEVKAALAGVVPNPEDIVVDLNMANYLTDDGEVDGSRVADLRARLEKLTRSSFTGSADAGPRGKSTPGQLARADLQSMTPKQITEAKAAGRLNDLLGIT